jgi:hypothetical protein
MQCNWSSSNFQIQRVKSFYNTNFLELIEAIVDKKLKPPLDCFPSSFIESTEADNDYKIQLGSLLLNCWNSDSKKRFNAEQARLT